MKFQQISLALAWFATSLACTDPASDEAGSETGESGESETGEPEPPTMLLEATQVSTGVLSVCAEALDGRLVCWGGNDVGQLGDGTLDRHTYPLVIDLEGVAEIELAWRQSCARTDAGLLYCWGDGELGQLGDGVAEDKHALLVPTQVPGLADVVDLSVSGQTTCVVLGDGSVWCWGTNDDTDGLGFPSELCGPYVEMRDVPFEFDVPCAPEPMQVPGITDAVEVSTGGSHQCVRHQDNTVSCWGNQNVFGTLGDGSTQVPETSEPRPVLGLTDVVQLETGYLTSCALVGDGSVWCWGYNGSGLLGLGMDSNTLPSVSEPTEVPGLPEIARLSVKASSACAVTTTGEVWCWGDTNYLFPSGQFPSAAHMSPIEVDFGAPAVDVDSAGFTTCILDVDNHVRCRGLETANGGSPIQNHSGDPVLWDG